MVSPLAFLFLKQLSLLLGNLLVISCSRCSLCLLYTVYSIPCKTLRAFLLSNTPANAPISFGLSPANAGTLKSAPKTTVSSSGAGLPTFSFSSLPLKTTSATSRFMGNVFLFLRIYLFSLSAAYLRSFFLVLLLYQISIT